MQRAIHAAQTPSLNQQPKATTRPCARRTHALVAQGIHAKLRIGRTDDPLEWEADHIADRIIAGGSAPLTASTPPSSTIKPKCAACAEESETVRRQEENAEEELQMKEAGGCTACGGESQAGAANAASAVSNAGAPLSRAMRAYFEPRFGRDFSDVRLHTDTNTGVAAAGIGARAYTLGSDIAFAAGEYAPGTSEGRRLLAHELGHVVQQRLGAPAALRRNGEGTSRFRERVPTAPTRAGSIWTGDVERTEYVPATTSEPETELHRRTVGVMFDEEACTVRVYRRVRFRQAGTSGTSGICDDSPPTSQAVTPLPSDEFEQIKSDYVETVNQGLNGWYTAYIGGAGCGAPCAGRDITIDVRLIDDDADPDFTIDVVNREGRGDAGTICARDGLSRGFAIHEGGHQLLGVGDEYAELDQAVCQRVPAWCREERVRRSDWSRMSRSTGYGRFALFHERHFQFIPAFLEAAFPDCAAGLTEVRRPILPDFRPSLSVGYASIGGRSAFLASTGFGVGFPLDRLREVEATIGVQGSAILAGAPEYRMALLLGLRAGIERRVTPSAGGLGVGAFVEAGVGRFSSREAGTYRSATSAAPYGQIGLSLGYDLAPESAFQPHFGIEATAGSVLTNEPPGESGASSAEWRRWFGIGATIGGRF